MNYLNRNNPIILFQESLNSEIYVDKSMLIEKVSTKIKTGNKYICITRPRRFGKTVNANMLGAYYTCGYDSHTLFEGLAISKSDLYPKHLNQHNVIFMDLSRMPDPCSTYESYISYVKQRLAADIEKAYGLKKEEGVPVSDLFTASGDSFIFILDEWDSIFYKKFMTKDEKEDYLGFLKNLLKDQPYVELAYMTGVLPIAKYSSGSELNMFDEYNFMNDNVYDRYFGFSEDEVKELCEQYQSISFDEVKQWYDGYYLSDSKSLFNPRSVSKALMRGMCLNYWTETGPMNEIADCIEHNVDEVREDIVKMVAGIKVPVKLKGYSASELQLDTRDEILSAMVVYGFLSYHDGYLCIPNHELMEKYQDVLTRKSMGEVKKIVERSKEMLEATLACDEDKVSAMLEAVHDKEIPFLNYNDENSLSCVITLCYLFARDEYQIEREARTGKGYCDYLFIPKKSGKPAIILELKVGKSCEDAILQIKKKNDVQKVEDCPEILLVGINYDEEKHHNCRIEKLKLKDV